MASFEEQIQKACNERIIPGVVLLATDVEGKFQYQKAFGPKDPDQPMGLDSTFILASCTKLMTSIAALQCVERGQIGLDEDVSEILPELKEPEILEGYEDGSEKPTLKKAREKITLRLLLTHASGIAYDAIHPNLVRWRTLRGQEPGISSLPMMDRISVPLVFEPGSGWIYGTGLDWAGVLVSRLNHTSLEAYMQQHIWDAVGAKDITFHQELKPSVKQNLVKMSMRGNIERPAFQLAVKSENGAEWTDDLLYDDPTEDEYGGSGAIGSPVEYLKIMHSILANDGRLLKPGTVEDMFKPQLGKESLQALIGFSRTTNVDRYVASLPLGTKIDYGLGGLLILSNLKTGLKKGSLTWSGLPNLLWTIDRDSGLALLYAIWRLSVGHISEALREGDV